MPKPIGLFLISLLLLSSLVEASSEADYLTFYLRDGSSIIFDNKTAKLEFYSHGWNRYAPSLGWLDIWSNNGNGMTRIESKDLHRSFNSIELLDPNLEAYLHGRAIITKRNGLQTIRKVSLNFYGNPPTSNKVIRYRELDVFTEKFIDKKIRVQDLKKIVFGGSKALMTNPGTGKMYPSDYKYDPYDGSVLVRKADASLIQSDQTGVEPNNIGTNLIKDSPASLKIIVTTKVLSVYSISTKNLLVKINGPIISTKSKDKVLTATPEVFHFDNIPSGKYEISASYGSKHISKTVEVNSNDYEFQLVFQ